MSIYSKEQETILSLFQKHFNEEAKEMKALPLSGSDRAYYRLTGDKHSAIGAYNPDRQENGTFIYFTQLFTKNKLPVPEILEIGSNKETYLLQDLGDTTLFQKMEQEGHTEAVKELFKKSISQLARLHWDVGREIDYSMCFAAQSFDKQQIFSDLLYFKYYFADPLKVKYNKIELLEELQQWSVSLASLRPQTFMYRDFQSRNIMLKGDAVFFIDYQGGMLGLPQYDLASLLWQARAQLPEEWKNELLNYYFTALQSLDTIPSFQETDFRKGYLECVLLRILQTLGAYGFRGLIERKPHFLKSIAPALKQLQYFLAEYPHLPAYNELRKVLEQLAKPEILKRFNSNIAANKAVDLKVKITSFSYKKGLPKDTSGHGGGFVFDCRGILNPGRIDAYKALTGRDEAVQAYLETQTRMPEFLEHIYDTIDITVEDYLQRGFDSLSIAFGCTGGQHRSVYAAEAMARHLTGKYGIDVTVKHREQGV